MLSPLIVLLAPVAEAAETGAIRGHVEDDQGIGVPGATIVLSGPGIAGQVTVQTDEEGDFRVVSAPVGTHQMEIVKSGFTKVQRKVTVRLDETAFVPVTLGVSGGEVVIVEEILPVIDTTRSSFSTELSAEMLANLPTGRSYQDAVNMIPGVYGRVDTESGGPGSGNPSVRGEGAYGNNYFLDGISTRDPTTKTFGQDVNFDAIEDIQVYTDGAPAEFGQATGMMVNVVTKDGGDEHHGSAAYYLSNSASTGKYDILNLETGVEEPTTKRTFTAHEVSMTAGGPVVKEKLWYFAGLDGSMGKYWFEGTDPAKDPAYEPQGLEGFAKLTWFATPDLSVQYQFSGALSDVPNYETSALYSSEAQGHYSSRDLSHMLTGRWRPDTTTELELKSLYFSGHIDVTPESGSEADPQIKNVETGEITNNYDSFDYNTRGRLGWTAKITKLLDGSTGGHKVKAGLEQWALTDSRYLKFTGPGDGVTYEATTDRPCVTEDYSDCSGYTEYADVGGALGHTGNVFSAFLQDDWQPADPVTLNVGARIDHETLYQNSGTQAYDAWMPAPRLGLAWDLTHDSKTLVSANYGRYYDVAGNGLAEWADTRSSYIFKYYEYNAQTGQYDLIYEQNPETNPSTYDENLRPYHMDKLALGIEREILPLFSIGVRGIVSHTEDLPEDVHTSDFSYTITNTEFKYRDYRALEFTAEKKLHDGWQVLASYTLGEAKGHMPGQFELSSGGEIGSDGDQVGVYLDDMNDMDVREDYFDAGYGWLLQGLAGLGTETDDAGYYGYLPYHSLHHVKVNGSYTFGFGTTLGLVYEFDSGHAWQKRGFVDLYGDYYAFPEGRGTRFMPPVQYVDVHLAHKLDFKRGRSAELVVNVYNVADFATPVTYYENDNASFGTVLYRQAPRSIEAGLKVTY
jgi:hypothetical protein